MVVERAVPLPPSAPRLVLQRPHPSGIGAIAFSPDGRLIATSGGVVRTWDAESGLLLESAEVPGFSGALAFSPNGQELAVASAVERDGHLRGAVTVFAVDGLRALYSSRTTAEETFEWVRFDSAGGKLVVATDPSEPDQNPPVFRVLDAATGDQLAQSPARLGAFESSSNRNAFFDSASGRSACAGQGGVIAFADLFSAGAPVLSPSRGPGDDGGVIALSPGGKLAVASNGSRGVLLDATTGAVRRELRELNVYAKAAFSPDGTLLALATSLRGPDSKERALVTVEDAATGREILRLDRPEESKVGQLRFRGDGHALSVSYYTTVVYDLASGAQLAAEPRPGLADSLPGSTRFAFAFGTDVALLDRADPAPRVLTPAGEVRRPLDPVLGPAGDPLVALARQGRPASEKEKERPGAGCAFPGAAFSADEHAFACADSYSGLKVVEASSGATLAKFARLGEVRLLALAKGGKTAAAALKDGRLLLGDASGALRPVELPSTATDDRAWSLAFSPDGRILAVGSGGQEDHAVWLFSAESGALLRTLAYPGRLPRDLTFTPDGALLAAGDWSSSVTLFDVATGRLLATVAQAPLLNRPQLAMSPDSKLLAVGGSLEHRIRLYRLPSGEEAFALEGHESGVIGLRFAAGGKRLVSSSDDGTVRLWDLAARRQELLVARLAKGWVAATPDGRFDGDEAGMATLHLVDHGHAIPLEAFFERNYNKNLVASVIALEAAPKGDAPDLAKGVRLPPKVRITSPADGQAVAGEELEVVVEAMDQGGGIADVRLYQNDKLVEEQDSRGVRKVPAAGAKVTRSFKVWLAPGDNAFKAIALNTDRTESAPGLLRVTHAAAAANAALYLLAVGINQYGNPKYRLNYGRPDAEAFVRAVQQAGKTLFRAIEPALLVDGAATKAAILAEVARIAAKARPEDVFVFYFAGHGVMSEAATQRPADFYLVPADVLRLYGDDEALADKALSGHDLKEMLTRVRAQKQLVVLDACQSGGALEAFSTRGAAEEKAILQLARSSGVVVLAATGSEQLAAEFKQLGHGIFTYALLEGLGGKAGRGADRKVTVKELEAYLNDAVPELTRRFRGEPQYPSSFARGQDFPIALAPPR